MPCAIGGAVRSNSVTRIMTRSVVQVPNTIETLHNCEPTQSHVLTDVPGPRSLEYLAKLGKYQDTRTSQLVMDSKRSFGNYLMDIDDNTFLDFHSQIASIAIGYNNPIFREKLDLDTLLNIMSRPALGVFPPEYVLQGVKKIMTKAPEGLNRVFLSMSGSDANDIAFKLAFIKYCQDRRGGLEFTEDELVSSMVNKPPGSPDLCILSFKSGFHGRLLGSLSATRSKPIHKVDIPAFKWPVARFPRLKYPLDDPANIVSNRLEEQSCLQEVETIIKTNVTPVAGLIVEPIQAEGGDNYATSYFFQGLRHITKKYNVVFIVDEVQTGVGSTGKFWAHDNWGLNEPPDIVTFAKKMQSGGLYYRDEFVPSHPFRNFNTWMGNPLDILKAGIIIDYIDDNELIPRVNEVGQYLLTELGGFIDIQNVRGAGAFIAFDMESVEARDELIESMKQRGVIINGCGEKTVRLRPMLVYDKCHVDEFLIALDDTLKDMYESD
jgi:4-aminobutyrate aminotransferase / (S)-3-amino-2-methylpropionate transaminase